METSKQKKKSPKNEGAIPDKALNKTEALNQKKSVIAEIGAVSDDMISLIASLAMGILLIAPGIMAEMAMFKRSIDFTMNIYLSMIKHLVFPLACSIVFVVYFIVIVRLHSHGVSIKKIIFRNPAFFIFFITSFLILASQLYNGAEYALTGFCAASLGETFGMEICYFVFILFGATQVKNESHKRMLLRIQAIVSFILVIAAFVLWKTQVESTFFSDWTPRFSSIFSNINYYGYYLAVSVPVAGAGFVYEKSLPWKVVAAISFIMNSIALSMDDTLGSWIGVILAIIFIVVSHFIVEKKVNWQTLVLIPVFALCLYIPGHITGTFETNFSTLASDMSNIMEGNEAAEQAGSARIKLWKAAMDIVEEHELMGIGFEGVKQRQYVGAPYNIRPHNEFIQYAMFHGIPMALMYIAGCLAIFIRALRKKKIMNGATLVSLSAAFGYLVSSFFGMTLFSTGYFLFVFLGMGYVNDDYIDSPGKEKAELNKKSNIHIGLITLVAAFIILTIFGIKGKIDSEKNTTAETNNQTVVPQGTATDQNGVVKSVPVAVVDGISYFIDDSFAVAGGFAPTATDQSVVNIPDTVEYEGKKYPVTVVYESAFVSNSNIKKVTVPGSVQIIEASAFDSCDSLEEVVLSDGLQYICKEAFNGCTSLKSLVIPSTVGEIENDAFYGCESLKSVTISNSLTRIPSGAFFGCSALKSVAIPESVTVIGSEAFRECESLSEVVLPEGLQSIEDAAFYSCTSLKSVRIPSTVQFISDSAFDYCDNLKAIYVHPDAVSQFTGIFEGSDFKVKEYE